MLRAELAEPAVPYSQPNNSMKAQNAAAEAVAVIATSKNAMGGAYPPAVPYSWPNPSMSTPKNWREDSGCLLGRK